jgi:hypothetical protein
MTFLIKNCGSENMRDEAREETLEKVAFDRICLLHQILFQYCVAKVV